MSDFLATMAETSAARWEASASEAHWRSVAADRAPAPALALSTFDLIAEVKLRAPSVGRLAVAPDDRAGFVQGQATTYAAAGACAISVLTEPSRFDGDLADLDAVSRVVPVPAMRKDFLVHPGQVWEGRAHGAGGVLLIARMLDDATLAACLGAALEAGVFVLLEAFDVVDLERSAEAVHHWPDDAPPLLVGVNTRDLATLQVAPTRLADLAPSLPAGVPGVAESGLKTAEDAAAARALGYRVALVGSALMASDDPGVLAAAMLAAGRGA